MLKHKAFVVRLSGYFFIGSAVPLELWPMVAACFGIGLLVIGMLMDQAEAER